MNDDASSRAFELLSRPETAAEGLRLLETRAEQLPQDATALFALASAYDMSDRETEAEALYQRVRAIGLERLPSEDRPRWYAQAGSTLRLLGRHDESRDLLREGAERFPDYLALRLFAALTEFAAGDAAAAAAGLFDTLLRSDDPSVAYFGRALRAYREEIIVRREPSG